MDPISPNERAFLALISHSEGTDLRPDPYRVCYGYVHTIVSFANHPAVTGEWTGERLPDEICRGAGYGPGCKSTAAGRYQLIRGTWLSAQRRMGLPDFSPASQDVAALFLIAQRGARMDVQAGHIAEAVDKCRREWASLPGANYAGQRTQKLDVLLAAYTTAGGKLASA